MLTAENSHDAKMEWTPEYDLNPPRIPAGLPFPIKLLWKEIMYMHFIKTDIYLVIKA